MLQPRNEKPVQFQILANTSLLFKAQDKEMFPTCWGQAEAQTRFDQIEKEKT